MWGAERMTGTQYEYKILSLLTRNDAVSTERLNKQGQEGWKVCGIVPPEGGNFYSVLMMRETP